MICLQREERRAITLRDLEHIDVDAAHVVRPNPGILCDTQQMICRIRPSILTETRQTSDLCKCPPKCKKKKKPHLGYMLGASTRLNFIVCRVIQYAVAY